MVLYCVSLSKQISTPVLPSVKLGWAKTGFLVVTIKKVSQISNKSMNEFLLVLKRNSQRKVIEKFDYILSILKISIN